jgi:hypothetical protein
MDSALLIQYPGAVKSGFNLPSKVGPRDENSAKEFES